MARVAVLTREAYAAWASQFDVQAVFEMAKAAQALNRFDLASFHAHISSYEAARKKAARIRKECEEIHGDPK
jgi:hypothetical protein